MGLISRKMRGMLPAVMCSGSGGRAQRRSLVFANAFLSSTRRGSRWSTTTSDDHLLRPALKALLPPIPLYRRLLRAHRKFLPLPMRALGDETVKLEWRAHRDVTNPAQILYVQKIEGQSWPGTHLEKAIVDKLNDDQLRQLYELMKTIRDRNEGGSSGDGNSA